LAGAISIFRTMCSISVFLVLLLLAQVLHASGLDEMRLLFSSNEYNQCFLYIESKCNEVGHEHANLYRSLIPDLFNGFIPNGFSVIYIYGDKIAFLYSRSLMVTFKLFEDTKELAVDVRNRVNEQYIDLSFICNLQRGTVVEKPAAFQIGLNSSMVIREPMVCPVAATVNFS
jgi:hypothetical protein